RGVADVILEAMQYLKLNLANATVAVQGFGNVGMHTARILHEIGAKIIAVSDAKEGVYNARGLDIPTLRSRYQSNVRPLHECGVGEQISNQDLLQLACTRSSRPPSGGPSSSPRRRRSPCVWPRS